MKKQLTVVCWGTRGQLETDPLRFGQKPEDFGVSHVGKPAERLVAGQSLDFAYVMCFLYSYRHRPQKTSKTVKHH